MSECTLCGRDLEFEERCIDSEGSPYVVKGHACHCLYEGGTRVAIGICCGHTVGEKTLAEEGRTRKL
jgi:hypothetical protein